MTAQDFKSIWESEGGKLNPIEKSRLDKFGLLPNTSEFLKVAGLPEYAEPNLNFGADLKLFNQQYNFQEDESEFRKYIIIGNCRDGDEIVINIENGDIIQELDHGDLFKPMYFNTSIETFAEFLLIYRQFETEVLKGRISDDNFQVYNFTDTQFDLLKARMASVDSSAISQTGFWKDELEILLTLRSEYFGR